jgi:hypothetical protein
MCLKLKAQILGSSVRARMLDLSIKLIFGHFLKFLELFKGFRLILHQIDIPISTQIIRKGHEVMLTIATLIGPHTSVCIIPNTSDARSTISVNGVLVILPRRHGSHVSNDSKSIDLRRPSLWSFFMWFAPT